MTDEERRARHAAYMRAYLADPERRADVNARKRERRAQNREMVNAQERARYAENRERILSARREKANSGPRRKRWSEAEVLDAIRELAVDGIAACPSRTSLPGVAANRFGSWAAACRAAGVIPAWSAPLAPDAKYSTVHSRLWRERGTPPRCDHCGAEGPGRRYEWALRLHVENPLFNEKGFPYSTRLEDYVRLCKACHNRMDRQRAA